MWVGGAKTSNQNGCWMDARTQKRERERARERLKQYIMSQIPSALRQKYMTWWPGVYIYTAIEILSPNLKPLSC